VLTCPVVVLLRPYTFGLIGFQAIWFLLRQNRQYEVVHILAYLPRVDMGVRASGKFDCVSGNSMDHFQVAPIHANIIAKLYSRIHSL
jgi:hypothetical protein